MAPDEAVAYWRARLAGARACSWPADHVPAGDPRIDRLDFTIAPSDTAALAGLAGRHAVAPLVVCAAAAQVLLARVGPEAGEQADVTIGLRCAGAALACRALIDPLESFTDLLRRAGDDIGRDLAVASAAGASDAGHGAADDQVPCRFVLDFSGGGEPGPSLADQAELRLSLCLTAGQAGGCLHYDARSFRPATAGRIVRCYLSLLRCCLAAPATRCGDLELADLRATADPAPQAGLRPAAELCGSAAGRSPGSAAVRWPGGELSYAGLAAGARNIARSVAGATLVSILAERSPAQVAALLGVLMAGAGYVPLDASHPVRRLEFVLADCGADLLLRDRTAGNSPRVPAGCEVVDLQDALAGTAPRAAAPGRRPAGGAGPDGIGYVMYTSGSTGRPKGVAMPQSALASLLGAQNARSAAGPGWNTLQFSPLSFDVSFQEIFATWSTGGTLILVAGDVRGDPRRLLDYLAEFEVHRLFLPYVALRMLAEAAVRSGVYPGQLREVITAGEQLRATGAVREFFRRTGASLDNQYGPTETHVATAHLLPGDPALWPELPSIGRALDGAAVGVLDARQRPLPVGVPGEICIYGHRLAAGYRGRPELTAERFVAGEGGRRCYRSGDVGRVLDDGRLEYLGRRDGQVKLRGYRVEIGEVEARLRALPGVADAIVLLSRASRPDLAYLVAYCVPCHGVPLVGAELRRLLAAELPGHMLPRRCVVLDRFPLTLTGKVDRRALGEGGQAGPGPAPESGDR